MAISLDSIQPTKHQSPPRIVVHGAEKTGKTTFAASAPNPIFIQTEDGLTGVEAQAFPLASTLQDVLDALNVLCSEDHSFESVVIDSADWLEKLIHKHICDEQSKASIEQCSGGYGKGYLEANNYWFEILEALNYLNKTKGMIVIVICHSRVVNFSDPTQEPYDIWKLKLHSPKSGNGACEMLSEWADIIAFAEVEKFVRNVSDNDDKRINRATGTQNRFLHLEHSAAFLAGNRYGINQKVPLSWDALYAALSDTPNQSNEAA